MSDGLDLPKFWHPRESRLIRRLRGSRKDAPATFERKFSSMSIIYILLASAFISALVIIPSAIPPAAAGSGPSVPATTYGTGMSGGPATMTDAQLLTLTGGSSTVASIELAIARYLQPLSINLVFYDILWGSDGANTSSTVVTACSSCTSTQSDPVFANWLNASAQYGIKTIIFFKQFGYFFSASSWDQDFLNQYPLAATDNQNGTFGPLLNGGTVALEAGVTSTSCPFSHTFSLVHTNTGIVVMFASSGGTGVTVSSVTDNDSYSYTKAVSSNHNSDTEIWYATATAKHGDTITVHCSGATSDYFAYFLGIGGLVTPISVSTIQTSPGFGASSGSSVTSYTPSSGSFILTASSSKSAGSCTAGYLFNPTNPNSENAASATLCGEYWNIWGGVDNSLGANTMSTISPMTTPAGAWDSASVAFQTAPCAGCFAWTTGWSISSPYLALQMNEDIQQLYKWYGSYTNWIGIGEGATGDRNYYPNTSDASIKTSRPFDNGTVYTFANSVFYERNINPATGKYLSDSSVSKLWNQFVNGRIDSNPLAGLSVGYGQVTNFTNPVYTGSPLTQEFYANATGLVSGFTLKAYISKVGAPTGGLTETLQDQYDGIGHWTTLETNTIPAAAVSTTPGWVSNAFTSILVPGQFYQVVFSSTTNVGNPYNVQTGNGVFPTTPVLPPIQNSILWVQGAGQNVSLYPWALNNGNNWPTTSSNPVYFDVHYPLKVNTVNWLDSDRAYDPNNVTFYLEIASSHTLLASGSFSTKGYKGQNNYQQTWTGELPYQLNATVNLTPGIKYEITFSDLPAGDNYAGSIGGGVTQDILTNTLDPPYYGQSRVPIFSLSYEAVNIAAPSNLAMGATDLERSPGCEDAGCGRGNATIALRFQAGSTESLTAFRTEVIFTNTTGRSGTLNFVATLRGDNTTCAGAVTGTCSHPLPTSSANSVLSIASVHSALTSCVASPTTQCTWANFTSWTGSVSLTSGHYYWITLSTTNGGYVELLREVSPFNYLVYASYDNFHSWAVSGDGPTDWAWQINTSVENINTNLFEGGVTYEFGNGGPQGIAQSFQSSSNMQLQGIEMPDVTGGAYGQGFQFTFQVRTDSGSDYPSNTVLAYSTPPSSIYGLSDSNGWSASWGLNVPVNMTGGVKYWIVINATCSASCSTPGKAGVNMYHLNSCTCNYGGTSLHYSVYAGGSSWTNQPYGPGDMRFIIFGSAVTVKTYNTKQLSAEIITKDNQTLPTETAPSNSGWNLFQLSEETQLMYDQTQLLTGLTNSASRTFQLYDGEPYTKQIPNFNPALLINSNSGEGGGIGCPPTQSSCGGDPNFYANQQGNFMGSILTAQDQNTFYPWASFGQTQENGGDLTPSNLQNSYLSVTPPTARQVTSFNDWIPDVNLHGIMNMTQAHYAQNFGTLLNRMDYNGGWYGPDKATLNVLFYVDSDTGLEANYLTSVANVTTTSDPTFSGFTLSHYNVIVIEDFSQLSSTTRQALALYVHGGGGLVETQFASNSGESDRVLGLTTNSSSTTPTSTLTIESTNKITSPYASISFFPYWMQHQTSKMGNESTQYLVEDSNSNPVITSNAYGSGKGVSLEQTASRLSSIGWGDSWTTLLINAVFYAGGHGSSLPVLWDTTYGSQGSSYYSIDGSGVSSSPVLVWASNNSTSKTSFDVHLNATYYGVTTSGWQAIDMQNFSVIASGSSGTDIHIKTTIPAKTWEPIYILNTPTNLNAEYTNIPITSQSSLGNVGTYVTNGIHNSSSWLVIQATSSVTSVSSSLTGTLSSQISLTALNQTTIGAVCTSIAGGGSLGTCNTWLSKSQEGWYYDSTHHIVYVHFRSGSPVTITIDETGVPTPPAFFNNVLVPVNPVISTSQLFSTKWTDAVGLSNYIFSYDSGSGTFVNDSSVPFTGTTNWSNVTKTLPVTIGNKIQWKAYAENTNNLWNTTYAMCTVPAHSGATSQITYALITDDCYDLLLYDGTSLYNLGNLPNLVHTSSSAVGYHSVAVDATDDTALLVGYNDALVRYVISSKIFTILNTGLTSSQGINDVVWLPGSSTKALITADGGNLFLYNSGTLTPIATGVVSNLGRVSCDPNGVYCLIGTGTTTLLKYAISGGGISTISMPYAAGAVAVAPSGAYAILAGSAQPTFGTVMKYNASTNSVSSISGVGILGNSYQFQAVGFSNDGAYVLITAQNNARGNLVKWTASSGVFTNVTSADSNTANEIAFAPNDSYAYITTTAGDLLKENYNSNTASVISLTDNRLRGVTFIGPPPSGFTVNFGVYPLNIASTNPSGTQTESGTISVTTSLTIAGGGYAFIGWTSTGGIMITSPSSASTTITVTADGTLTANYNPTLSCGAH